MPFKDPEKRLEYNSIYKRRQHEGVTDPRGPVRKVYMCLSDPHLVLHSQAFRDGYFLTADPEDPAAIEGHDFYGKHIFSFKVGVMKPDPRIWQVMLERASLQAGQCLYIDDLEPFCAAAGRLGFHTLHYRKGETDLVGELIKRL